MGPAKPGREGGWGVRKTVAWFERPWHGSNDLENNLIIRFIQFNNNIILMYEVIYSVYSY